MEKAVCNIDDTGKFQQLLTKKPYRKLESLVVISQLKKESNKVFKANNLPSYQHLFFCSSHKSTTTLSEIITAVNYFYNYKKLELKLLLIHKLK